MLDVNQLSEKGCLKPGCTSVCRWINGNEVFSIKLSAGSERLHLHYKVRVGEGEWEHMAEIVPIVYLPCRFGGSRPFFICPGDGTDWGRRVAKLHLSRRYFLCRHCNELAYASQYETTWQRALTRGNKLKHRLGIDVKIGDLFPDKPKGMWVSTYASMLDEILQTEILANEARSNMFKRLLARYSSD
jgi:hypothetical protein